MNKLIDKLVEMAVRGVLQTFHLQKLEFFFAGNTDYLIFDSHFFIQRVLCFKAPEIHTDFFTGLKELLFGELYFHALGGYVDAGCPQAVVGFGKHFQRHGEVHSLFVALCIAQQVDIRHIKLRDAVVGFFRYFDVLFIAGFSFFANDTKIVFRGQHRFINTKTV